MAPEEPSIVERLEAAGHAPPRVRIGDAEAAGGDAPVLRRSGRYEILGALAEGGVGEVFKGRDVDLGRDVAIKVLRTDRAGDPEILQRFVDEAQIGGQLQHPGVVPVYELGVQADLRPFFAMKLVKGETLAALLKAREDPTRERRRFLRVFAQICQTIAYAHARGVVHRDLKPANVMVGSFGEVQVLDWGFAKVLARGGIADEREVRDPDVTKVATVRSGAEGSHSIAGSVMGTPAYMPPEQALGLVDRLDPRSDVFSLGAILCEILTGQPAYVGEDKLIKAAHGRLEDAMARLDACGADPALVVLAKRCLATLREDRPRNAAQLADAVQAHLGDVEERAHRARLEAAEAKAASARARREAAAQTRARRQVRLVAAAVALLVVTAGGGFAWIRRGERAQRERAHAAVATALERAQDLRAEGRFAEALTAADEARVLAADADEAGALRLRADAVHADLERAAREAAAAAEARARDETLLARLDDLRARGLQAPYYELHALERDYAAAFRAYGLDPDEPVDPARIARAIDTPLRLHLVSALDRWIDVRRFSVQAEPDAWRRLAALADALDPSADSRRLRRLWVGSDREAVLEALASIEGTPGEPTLAARRAGMLQGLGRTSEQERLLEDALLRAPADVELLLTLATLSAKTQRMDRFLSCARTLVALEPRNPAFAWWHAGALETLGRRDPARASYLRALDLSKEDLGRTWDILLALRRLEAAEREAPRWRTRAEADPDDAQAWFLVGLEARIAGEAETAREALDRVHALRPHDITLAYAIAIGHAIDGDHGKGLEALGRAVRHDPWSALRYSREIGAFALAEAHASHPTPTVDGLLARLQTVAGDLPALLRASYLCDVARASAPDPALRALGLAACRRAAALAPDSHHPHAQEADLLFLAERPEEALAAARRNLDRAPLGTLQWGWAVHRVALGLWKTGRPEEALAAIREAVALDPSVEESHNALIMMLAQLDRDDEAIDRYRRLVETSPTALSWRLLGRVYQWTDRVEEALGAYEEAHRLRPTEPDATVLCAGLRAYLGPPGADAAFARGVLDSTRGLDANTSLKLRGHLVVDDLRRGDTEAALEAALDAQRAHPGHVFAWELLGFAAARHEGGEKAYARGLDLLRVENPGPLLRGQEHASLLLGIGWSLVYEGRLPEASAWFERGWRVAGGYGRAWTTLTHSLVVLGDWETLEDLCAAVGGIAAVEDHFVRFWAALEGGRLAEAADVERRETEQEAVHKDYALPSRRRFRRTKQVNGEVVRWLERLEALRPRLEELARGTLHPATAAEAMDAADLCAYVNRPATAARLYARAFDLDPTLADHDPEPADLVTMEVWFPRRFRAVRAALRAAAGKGDDTEALTEEDGARLRQTALGWLRDELPVWRAHLARRPPSLDRLQFFNEYGLAWWLGHGDLACVRDELALAGLPEQEREAWQALWTEVRSMIEASIPGGVRGR